MTGRGALTYSQRVALAHPARLQDGLRRVPFRGSWAGGDGGRAAEEARARLAERKQQRTGN